MKLSLKKLSYKSRKNIRLQKPLEFSSLMIAPRVFLNFSKNNIFFNFICRLQKEPKLYATFFWLSCGSKKFSIPQYRGSAKTSYVSNYSLGVFIAQKVSYFKFGKKVIIAFKGFGNYFKIFLKAFKLHYKFTFNLLDLTPIALNGCRLRRKKRV